MKKYRICYYTGLALSLLVGLWHFFVPWMFQWHAYIPDQYENLIVAVDWLNFCFSAFLFGLSLLLLLWGGKVFARNREAVTVYGFLTVIWILRVGLAIVEPWPLKPIPWAAYGQLAASVFIAVLLTVPLVKLLCTLRRDT